MSLDLKVDISELERFAEDMRTADRPIGRIMHNTMQKSVDYAQEAIRLETPVNTGKIRQSIATEIRGTSAGITGEIFTPLVYGLPLEYGRKPGRMPPVDVIQLWVHQKGIAAGQDERQVAYLIARAIGRRGTKGAHMFEKGMKNAESRIMRLWEDATGDILAEFANE